MDRYATSLTKMQMTSCSSIPTKPIGTQNPPEPFAKLAPLSPRCPFYLRPLSRRGCRVVSVSNQFVSVRHRPISSAKQLSTTPIPNTIIPFLVFFLHFFFSHLHGRTDSRVAATHYHTVYLYQRQAACGTTTSYLVLY